MKRESELFLTSVECIGYKTIDRLINRYGSFEDIWKLTENEIIECDILTERQKKEYIKEKKLWNMDRYLNYMNNRDIKVITRYDSDYPKRLINIADPPFQLFYIGRLPDENIPTVSIIGARNCSEYGKSCARYFAKELAEAGIQIISGLASGIDGISQEYAIKNRTSSYGILGSGVDICYPQSNWQLFENLKLNGGVISEFPPGSKPVSWHFPMRNRIISGLADIVLVIEAKEKSGTAITVNMALEQGREVFAVPGRIDDALSSGCNRLISEGAGVARCAGDIIEALGLVNANVNVLNAGEGLLELVLLDDSLSYVAKRIAEMISIKAMSVNELCNSELSIKENLSVQDIQAGCMELEISDYASEENGKVCLRRQV